ncbi:hypothetical protein GGI20_004627 [Coemansia sp. BCRC 34301]|nr:hypothetical protein GGI20_004627 [Coemansia sp. BCRC 34301]
MLRINAGRLFSTLRQRWAQAAVYETPGDASSVLRVASRQLPADLGQSSVLVQMLAAPVNPSDLNQIEGTYPVLGRFHKEVLSHGDKEETAKVAVGGNEGVGVVRAVGSGVSDLREGDWVVPRRAGEFGTWCTQTVVDRDQVTCIPLEWRQGVDTLTVGSLRVNASTAYRMLRDFVALREGDCVIQNAANSGVGRAVIQLAHAQGIRTINVVRDRPEYADLEHELKDLGADIIVRDTDLGSELFRTQVRALGNVKLGLNGVGGRATLAMAKHLSQGAALVSYGGMSRQPLVVPTSLLLFRDVAVRGFWMNRWYELQTCDEKRDHMWKDILRLAALRRFRAQPMKSVVWNDDTSLDDAQAQLRVDVVKECAECLVYQHQESSLRGKLHIKTSDKLKLRQITIRLVSTELVDIHGSDSNATAAVSEATGNAFLQKSTKTIGTWVVLAKGGDAHVLGAGEHQYSFEIALPRGLDGSVDTGAYRLAYELESRVEHSFVLKPATVMLTPVTLVQVPMGLNLHSDDRLSMKIVSAAAVGGRALTPEDVPLGHAVCVHADAIDQGRAFVLCHLWDAAVAVRLRLPRGRVFATDAHAVVDIQAVPITRDFRCTSITLRLEEIAIIARPQRSGGSPAAVVRHGSVAANRIRPPTTAGGGLTPLRRHSVANSAVSNSSEDSVVLATGDSAAAYAQECSAEYQNAITSVRTLATTTHTAWPDRPNVSLAEFSGIAAARLRLHVTPTYGSATTHTDIRNSHIQVHHQIAYEVRYERVEHSANDHRDASPDARILAVARVYSTLGDANIVRRDELKERTLRVVRGTLPVAIVPKKISALWGLKNMSYDDDYEEEEADVPGTSLPPPVASFPVPHRDFVAPRSDALHANVAPVSVSAPGGAVYVPSPAMLDMMHGNSSVTGMPSIPSIPGMPAIPSFPGIPGVPNFPSAYSPPPSQPLGFNPMFMPQVPAFGYPMGNGYDTGAMPGYDTGYGVGGPAYNPTALQQQIQMFQEQQRMQQQQFFQQLSEQYGQMVVSPQPALSNSLPSLNSANPQHYHHQVANTYGPPPPPPTTVALPLSVTVAPPSATTVPQEQVAENFRVDSEPSALVPLATAVASDEPATVTEPSAPSETSGPARPDSAADTNNSSSAAVDVANASVPSRDTHLEAVQPPPVVVTPPAEQPAQSDAAHSIDPPPPPAAAAAAAVSSSSEGRHSPPPNYDDLLPPEYDVPANQPPPYRPLESNRSRRRMWDM